MKNISDESKNKLKSALKEYRAAKKEYGWQAALTPKQISHYFFLACIVAITVIVGILKAASHHASIIEQDIISIARKYDFEIVADKNEYKNWGEQKVKVIAKASSASGSVWFGSDFVIYEEGYILFPPDTIYRRKYSDYRKTNSIEELEKLFSDRLSGSMLERTVQAFREIVNL